jgi:hypothetical protein
MPMADHQTAHEAGEGAFPSTPHFRQGRRVIYQFGLPATTPRECMLVLEAFGVEFEILFERQNG